jgi:hypothetical protein
MRMIPRRLGLNELEHQSDVKGIKLTNMDLCVLLHKPDELVKEKRADDCVDEDESHVGKIEWQGTPKIGFVPEVVSDPVRLYKY